MKACSHSLVRGYRAFFRRGVSRFSTQTQENKQQPSHIRGQVDFPVNPNYKDLSHVSGPIGQLFGKLPTSGAGYKKFLLSAEQREFYRLNGYLTNVKIFTEEECDKLIAELKSFTNQQQLHPGMFLFHEFHWNQSGNPDNVLLHALGHWRITPLFHDLIYHPHITTATAQLLKVDQSPNKRISSPDPDSIDACPVMGSSKEVEVCGVRFWHDQLFAKPAKHGGHVAWHQDYSYWTRTKPMNHMTVHLALDTQTVENGTLHFVPGSHRWRKDVLPITSDDFSDMDSIQTILTPEEKKNWKAVPALLNKGEVSFHHPLMVHGSYSNRSNQPRRAAVLNYFSDGTLSDNDQEMLRGVPVIPKGQKMGGQFFPLVFDLNTFKK